MNKNIVIIHYNTPYLTECLVRSINLFVKNATIYIFDNSDKLPFKAKFKNVKILDNTKGQIINFNEWIKKFPERTKTTASKNNYGSAKHCYSVEKCMEILDENFILLDSDILLKKDISDLIKEDCVLTSDTELWKAKLSNKVPKYRATPYICFINVKLCKKHNVHYYNPKFIFGLTKNGDNYDTGTYFLEQIKQKKLKWQKIHNYDYIVHYKGGSWIESARKYDNYKRVDANVWLKMNKKYWDDGTVPNKKVIYTCITGGYDKIIEPKCTSEGFDYVCFTDNENFKSDIWDIRPLPDETSGLTTVKKQRYVKTHPHILFEEYDVSIWVDGNIEIKGNLNKFVEKNIKEDCSVFVPTHPSRNCIYMEEKAVLTIRKDKKENTRPQIERYKSEGFPAHNGLLQSNILLRKHNDEDCIALMEDWWKEIERGSHRDQLSFNYVAWKHPEIMVTYLDKKIYDSEWFNWHKVHNKTTQRTTFKKVKNRTPQSNKKSIAQLKSEFEAMLRTKRRKMITDDIGIYKV